MHDFYIRHKDNYFSLNQSLLAPLVQCQMADSSKDSNGCQRKQHEKCFMQVTRFLRHFLSSPVIHAIFILPFSLSCVEDF